MLLAYQCFGKMCNIFVITIVFDSFVCLYTRIVRCGEIEYLLCRLIARYQFDVIHSDIVVVGYEHDG